MRGTLRCAIFTSQCFFQARVQSWIANIKLRVSILFDRDTLEGRNLETASIWFSPLLLLFLLFKRLETTDSSPSIVIYAHTPVYHPSLGVTSERDKDECPAYAGATMHSHAELNDDETTSNWLIKNRQLQTHCNDRTAAQVLGQNPTSLSQWV